MKVANILRTLLLLLLFSCRNDQLPSLHIKRAGEIGWSEKAPCIIFYSDSDNTDELKGRIKYRGGISRKYDKRSFSIELDKKYSFSTLPNDDDWIINANYIDKTFMRHKISYDLFREMSSKNVASRSTFVNVSVNDNYEGLYVLMEEVNGSMVGLNKSDTAAMLFKDPPIFRKERLEYVQDPLNYYQQKFPKIDQSDKTYYLEEFKDFLFYSSDSDFAREISTWVDIENVIDWHLILLFTNNEDGIMKNFYLYKLDRNTPFRFAIWDYDHSFGRDGDNERNLMERELNCNRAILIERLSECHEIEYLTKLKERWGELREQNIFSVENIEKHIEKNDKIIGAEIEKNFEKWPVDEKWYYDNSDYRQELDLMREFVEIRIKQLDDYFNSL